MESLIKRIDLKIIIVLFILSSSCKDKCELSKEEIKIKKDLVLFSDKIQTMNISTIKSLMHATFQYCIILFQMNQSDDLLLIFSSETRSTHFPSVFSPSIVK